MSFTRESAVESARSDLANRLGIPLSEAGTAKVTDKDFPDMSLGAPAPGEMSAQMISSGWQILIAARDREYEYRADKYQLRLCNFEGKNIVIGSS